jgi:hypothetical protein
MYVSNRGGLIPVTPGMVRGFLAGLIAALLR